MLRTGDEYRDTLLDEREVWVDGNRCWNYNPWQL